MSQKRLIIITGASSGIGMASAIEFSRHGYPLLLIARRKSKMEDLNLPQTICAQADVTDSEQLKASIESAERQYGPCDCLVNNAGVQLLGTINTQDPSEWQRMFNVNVLGLLSGTKIVLCGMLERNRGTIINVSSVAGHKTFPSHVAYSGTKFAVHGISESLREEVSGSNVRVSVISPGAVETELLSHTTDENIKKNFSDWRKSIGGALRPEIVASTIRFTYEQPQEVCIREIRVSPTRQPA